MQIYMLIREAKHIDQFHEKKRIIVEIHLRDQQYIKAAKTITLLFDIAVVL